MFASDLLRRHHVASLAEVGILFDTLAWDLLLTALVWLLYQGLELYGFHLARAGRPLLNEALLPD